MRQLFYGDNLPVMQSNIPDAFADLIYLDPPFNSKKAYNAIFAQENPGRAAAQIQAFDDTWVWDLVTEQEFERLSQGGSPRKVADTLAAFRKVLGENDLMAYLVMMTARLLEMHRVLKQTGSLYLHCDPTASHYLKMVLDSIFGPTNFRSEVVWKRTHSHNSAMRWGPIHDVILFYTKSRDFVWNAQYQAYSDDYLREAFNYEDERGRFQPITLTGPGLREGDSGQPWRNVDPSKVGRHWQPSKMFYDLYEKLTGESLAEYLMAERLERADAAGLIWWPKKVGGVPRFKQYAHLSPGLPLQDVITDIPRLSSKSAERLGYPTQKPLALLRRIIQASSNPGDIVFDPFCGCGTTVAAAEELGRGWVGIDIAYIAIDLILKRLEDSYGSSLMKKVETSGIPRDLEAARSLHANSHFEFERWAVSLVSGEPKAQPGGDKGVDGIISFVTNADKDIGTAIVEVKGGGTSPADVRSLAGTVAARGAEMGVFICIAEPTRKMREAANEAGTYYWPFGDRTFSRVVIISVAELLDGKRPEMPTPLNPFLRATRQPLLGAEQQTL